MDQDIGGGEGADKIQEDGEEEGEGDDTKQGEAVQVEEVGFQIEDLKHLIYKSF